MEKETVTTKQNYYINFLYDLLDMLRGYYSLYFQR